MWGLLTLTKIVIPITPHYLLAANVITIRKSISTTPQPNPWTETAPSEPRLLSVVVLLLLRVQITV